MRVILQRVKASQVVVDGEIIGCIGPGLNLLVGIAETDTYSEMDWMVQKCLSIRVFPSSDLGRFDLSVQDIQGSLLVISQFTLYGDCRKGRRPSFAQAAALERAVKLYEYFVAQLRQSGVHIETGKFGAHMEVTIENDGPVTLVLERDAD
ncbi:MAG: D-aminoacyl-tRNA deacylase [Cyanobacteria bacterium P01_D01_bin.156]